MSCIHDIVANSFIFHCFFFHCLRNTLFPKHSQHIEPNADRGGNSISSGQGVGICTVAKYLYEIHFVSDIYFAVGAGLKEKGNKKLS